MNVSDDIISVVRATRPKTQPVTRHTCHNNADDFITKRTKMIMIINIIFAFVIIVIIFIIMVMMMTTGPRLLMPNATFEM